MTGTADARAGVLAVVADAVLALPATRVRRVGIDGVDGAGKTVFADELAGVLAGRGLRVIRAGVDGFHLPRVQRYRRGRASPEGFYQDSYDYGRMRRVLLDPLGPGGGGRYRTAVHDVRSDADIEVAEGQAEPGDVLVMDGIFLHRPQLRGCWDCSVFLDVDPATATGRMAARDGGSPDPDAVANRRYVLGQRLYLAECSPWRLATFVIDNNEFAAPRILTRRNPLQP